MDKHDVIKKVGRFPDSITEKKTIKSTHWKCSKCLKDYVSDEPVTNPAPCTCGSIFFETVKN
jgi:hypothetical protein